MHNTSNPTPTDEPREPSTPLEAHGRRNIEAPGNPWSGLRVLVPRAKEQALATAELLRARGAEAVLLPTVRLAPPPDPAPARRAAEELEHYDLVLFTSANAVRRFAEFLAAAGKELRAIPASRVRALGPATADALEALGVTVSGIPDRFVAEGMLEQLRCDDGLRAMLAAARRPRILLPRALVGREVLPEGLRAMGCDLDVVPVYATLPVSDEDALPLRRALRDGQLHVVLLTSGSTAEGLADLLASEAPADLTSLVVGSIGPITTRVALARGLPVTLTASESTLPALLEAIERELRSRTEGSSGSVAP